MPRDGGSNEAPLPYNVTADPATRVAGAQAADTTV